MANKNPDEKAPANEIAAKRAWLRDHGVPAQVAAQLIKPANTRRRNGDAIAAWLKDRPKSR